MAAKNKAAFTQKMEARTVHLSEDQLAKRKKINKRILIGAGVLLVVSSPLLRLVVATTLPARRLASRRSR